MRPEAFRLLETHAFRRSLGNSITCVHAVCIPGLATVFFSKPLAAATTAGSEQDRPKNSLPASSKAAARSGAAADRLAFFCSGSANTKHPGSVFTSVKALGEIQIICFSSEICSTIPALRCNGKPHDLAKLNLVGPRIQATSVATEAEGLSFADFRNLQTPKGVQHGHHRILSPFRTDARFWPLRRDVCARERKHPASDSGLCTAALSAACNVFLASSSPRPLSSRPREKQ